jgi:uncharacterized protein YqgV (UPF0045/DUF77 family)
VTISAQISLYPLRQARLGDAIEALRAALEREGLAPEVGPMSTLVSGGDRPRRCGVSSGPQRVASRWW